MRRKYRAGECEPPGLRCTWRRWERACLFVAEVAEALVEVAASVAAAAATTTSEVEAAAISEAAAAAEEDLDEGAAAELLTEARTTDLQSK